jgi:hypothetical protein
MSGSAQDGSAVGWCGAWLPWGAPSQWARHSRVANNGRIAHSPWPESSSDHSWKATADGRWATLNSVTPGANQPLNPYKLKQLSAEQKRLRRALPSLLS